MLISYLLTGSYRIVIWCVKQGSNLYTLRREMLSLWCVYLFHHSRILEDTLLDPPDSNRNLTNYEFAALTIMLESNKASLSYFFYFCSLNYTQFLRECRPLCSISISFVALNFYIQVSCFNQFQLRVKLFCFYLFDLPRAWTGQFFLVL